MSLPGFDAIGRFALGQINPGGNKTLTTSAISYAETGGTSLFGVVQASSGTSYSFTGRAATINPTLAGAAGSFAEGGAAAIFSARLALTTASYSLAGVAVSFLPSESARAGAFILTGNASTFSDLLGISRGSFAVSGGAAVLTRDFINWLPANPITDIWTPVAESVLAPTLPFSGGYDGLVSGRFAPGQLGQFATAAGVAWKSTGVPSGSWTSEPEPAQTWTPALTQPDPWSAE